MIILKPDYVRRIEIPGVAAPVKRPVDISRSQTSFSNLRSLRIYQFDAGSVIDGHAEEDEVFVVILAGLVNFVMRDANSEQDSEAFTLSAPWSSDGEVPCVAYLQPGSAYRLTAETAAEVAYARATPAAGPASTVFRWQRGSGGTTVRRFEEVRYARRLHLRLFEVEAGDQSVPFSPIEASEDSHEALVHVRTSPADGGWQVGGTDATRLEAWDTVAVGPGERPDFRLLRGSQASILVVSAV